MNEGMIKNLVARIKGGNPVAITKPSTYKPPVPSPAVKAAQAKVDADYKARVKAGTPAARTERMKARIAAMKEEVQQIDEIGDTPSGLARLKTVQARAHNTMNKWSKNPKSGYSSTPPEVRKATKTSVRASNRINKDPTTGRPFAYASLRREEVEQIDEISRDTAIQAYAIRKGSNSIDPERERTAKDKRFGRIIANKAKRDATFKGAKSAGDAVARHVGNAGLAGDDYAKTIYPGPKVYKKNQKNINAVMKKLDLEESVEQIDEVNEGAEYIEERLKASDPTSKWISDFVHSDNPRFKGKTKKERINMALGAYYAKKKEMKEAKLDPVGQEDSDVNNDGKHGHSTDKYLMKRRAAISQAIKNKK